MSRRTLPYWVLDVFTDRALAGNPVAVFPEAGGLDDATAQAVAREMNLSESVFVTGHEAQGYRVRIMTPTTELPFAGHPTLGTGVVLALAAGAADTEIRLLEQIGPVSVTVTGAGQDRGHARFALPRLPHRLGEGPDAELAARLLGLPPEAVRGAAARPQCWSAGVPFTMIGVADQADLARASLDLALWREALAGGEAPMVYVYWPREPGQFAVRMFAPGAGVPEDPGTGAAAAAFAGLYAEELADGDGEHPLLLAQGDYIGRPCRIELAVRREAGRCVAAAIGGSVVRVAEGTLATPG